MYMIGEYLKFSAGKYCSDGEILKFFLYTCGSVS